MMAIYAQRGCKSARYRRAFWLLGAGVLLALGNACTHTPLAAKPAPQLLNKLSDQDLKLANRQVQRALETLVSGKSLAWRSKTGQHSGAVTPRRTYKANSGFFCRVYTESFTIDGVTEQYDGTACRSRRGVWEPI